jgi:hypothetical protein
MSMFDLTRLNVIVHDSISGIATSRPELRRIFAFQGLVRNSTSRFGDVIILVVVNCDHPCKHRNVHMQMDFAEGDVPTGTRAASKDDLFTRQSVLGRSDLH